MVEPPRLKSSFLPWEYRCHTDCLHSTFSHPPTKSSKKALNFPKRNFIFMPCLELDYMPSIQGCWASSKTSVQKPILIKGESHASIKREIPRPKTIWNQESKCIENTWATLRLFTGRRHIGITAKWVCEEVDMSSFSALKLALCKQVLHWFPHLQWIQPVALNI